LEQVKSLVILVPPLWSKQTFQLFWFPQTAAGKHSTYFSSSTLEQANIPVILVPANCSRVNWIESWLPQFAAGDISFSFRSRKFAACFFLSNFGYCTFAELFLGSIVYIKKSITCQ